MCSFQCLDGKQRKACTARKLNGIHHPYLEGKGTCDQQPEFTDSYTSAKRHPPMNPGPGTEEPIMPRLPLMLPKLEPISPACRVGVQQGVGVGGEKKW